MNHANMKAMKCALPARLAIVAAIACAISTSAVHAGSTTYTFDADFDLGALFGVNHDAPNNDQLQLNAVGTTFPVLWIANAGEDTVSKFDSANNRETARYRTWFGPSGQPGYQNHLNNAFAGAAPSRTAVDPIDGNAYVLNRHFQNVPATLIKILREGGIDRNGNSVIDTSSDANSNNIIDVAEMKNLADSNGNSRIDPDEIQDERIAWAVSVGPSDGLGRALCIGPDRNLWVGLYNSRQYYKVSAADGSILAGPVSVSWTPYGCLIDGDGTLWSASLGNILGKITNTTSNTGPYTVTQFSLPAQSYGIALGNSKVYLGASSGGRYIEFDPATNSASLPGQGTNYVSTGISVDGSGNILTGPFSGGGVFKYAPNGAVVWTSPTQFSSETRGVIIDQDNNVWQVSKSGARLMKYRGSDGAPLGVFPIGNQPYTYSDASGFSAGNVTTQTGTWTVVQDGGRNGVKWGTASWNATIPAGASVIAEARAADATNDLQFQSFVPVTNNVGFNLMGRFIEARLRLTANSQGQSPVLLDATLSNGTCDIDGDGDIDRNDINQIFAGRGQTATLSDPRDDDFDGLITVTDGRRCVLKCTRANCAI